MVTPALRLAVDEPALARHLRRLEAQPSAPWLHTEAARRMAERLPLIRLQPATVIDWWPHLGGSAATLAAAYPKARRIGVERVAPQPATSPWWRLRRRDTVIAEDAVADASAQLVWSNMMLHATRDPRASMARWQRALAVDGFLMFSTLGPGTFEALTALYRRRGWAPAFAPFVDMHDLGDMLVAAGFADPVMDQETLTLTWGHPAALLAELRTIGGNVAADRAACLRTPRWRQRLEQALQQLAGADGRPALQVELVFGHAFKPPPRPRVTAVTAVPLDDMRAMVRGRRDTP